jgi:outer membrane protein assembly factor BamA
VLASLVLIAALLGGAEQPERVADIQVHGNTLTPDAEILRLAGVAIGQPLTDKTLNEVAARLRASHKFEHVDVLKRFASIADPSQIAVVIVVDEGAVTIQNDGSVTAGADGSPGLAGVVKRGGVGLMFLPILDFEDGYGLSYGARFAAPDVIGKGSRVSFPATWGGEKRAGVELDRELSKTITRVQVGADLIRKKNPFFKENDDRRRVWVRGERDLGRSLRVGATAAWQHVSFFDASDRFIRTGADVVFDTRIDPMLARNAVYGRAAWDHLAFRTAPDANRTDLEGRAYVGLLGQSVLVIRGLRQDADRALPPYLSPLLGGTANLRGFKAGSAIGDTLVASSAELRLPVTSPLSVGKLGVSAFVDVGSVYDNGERVRAQHFERGVGGGVWFSAAFVRLNLYIAHGLGGSTRAHFGTTVVF